MIKNNKNIDKKNISKQIKKIFEKCTEDKQKIRDYFYIILYVLTIFIMLYTLAKTIKTKTNFYNENLPFRWYNVLSYDDMFYARDVYNSSENYTDDKYHLVKHPLFDIYAKVFSYVEDYLFDNDETDHYFHIVVFQILVNVIGILYLYKILREQLNIRNIWCFILLTIYELATVTLLGTLVIDSFIFSATLLIMSYYYLAKQKIIPSIIIGILTAGVTITNSIPFALMTLILIKDRKKILKIGLGCIGGLLLISLILPYRDIIYNNLLLTANTNMERYAQNQDIVTFLKMAFYNIITSPLFFINLMHTKVDGLDYVTFDLSSGRAIIITTIIFFMLIFYNIIKYRKDRNVIALVSIFAYNMILHIIIRFGLHVGTIYGLHFLFSEILMFAYGFKIKNKILKNCFIGFSIVFLMVQIRYNIYGLLEMMLSFKDWI